MGNQTRLQAPDTVSSVSSAKLTPSVSIYFISSSFQGGNVRLLPQTGRVWLRVADWGEQESGGGTAGEVCPCRGHRAPWPLNQSQHPLGCHPQPISASQVWQTGTIIPQGCQLFPWKCPQIHNLIFPSSFYLSLYIFFLLFLFVSFFFPLICVRAHIALVIW